jgi:hypothetical protein
MAMDILEETAPGLLKHRDEIEVVTLPPLETVPEHHCNF